MRKSLKFVLLLGTVGVLMAACGNKASSNVESTAKGTEQSTESVAATEKSTEKATEKAEVSEKKMVEGTVNNTIDLSKYEKGKKVRLWIPVPQSSEYQTVEDVKYDAGNAKAEMNTDDWGNQMLYVEWDENAEPADRVVKLDLQVKREEIVSPELKEDEKAELPEDDQVKNKAAEVTEGKTTDLEKARTIYDWVIANMNRDESVKGCGEGDVCALLDTTMSGKCTDINSMFVALCRASGIPAREHFGIRINADDITKNQHCWAEFYLKGTGWVSADPADVLKAVLKNNWTKDQAETKEKQEYYFGNCDAERMILSDGRDLTLNPAQDGEALNDFGYPYAEVDGVKLDNYTPDQFVYTYSFAKKA